MADPKAEIRLPRILHAYLDDLADLGVYGKDKSGVIRRFIESGVQDALGKGLLQPKKKRDFADGVGESGDDD